MVVWWDRFCQPAVRGPVLDLSHGAGTTSLAAQRVGQDAVGIELNPEYVEIARTRLGGAVDFFLWGLL